MGSYLHASPLLAQNITNPVKDQHSAPLQSFSNYRTFSSHNKIQQNHPQSQAVILKKQFYSKLSSNNPVTLVGFEEESEPETETVPEYQNLNPDQVFTQQECLTNPPQYCTQQCNPTCDFTFRDDLHNFCPMLWEDTKQLINWRNGLYLGVALGGSLALRDSVDDKVRENTARHKLRWGNFSRAMEDVGSIEYQIPVVAGLYSYSLYKDNPKLHSFSQSLISAMTINGLTTVTIKAIANTDRPSDDYNDGEMGFPSYHTSSMFTFASVVDEYYGHWAGATAYTFAGLVGWSRIDQRHHDLSDVIFGAALGTIIGKGVAQFHQSGNCNYRVAPYIHPTSGGTGMMMDIRF